MNSHKSFVLSLILFNWLPCLSQSTTCNLVIKNVSVIDIQNSKIIPKQTIYIKEERIAKIEKSKKYKKIVADTIIDGTGKFILSGFWDMHILSLIHI